MILIHVYTLRVTACFRQKKIHDQDTTCVCVYMYVPMFTVIVKFSVYQLYNWRYFE